MKKLLFSMLLVMSLPLAAAADSSLVKFNGAISVDPVRGTDAGNAPVSNVICGVNPGVTPWHIDDLRARINDSGRIVVDGHGLLVAASNSIGTNLGQTIQAQLFCNTSSAGCGTPFTSSPTGVALEDDGDFHIDDTLSPLPPMACPEPVLLITQIPAKGGRWFAAGISLKSDH
ncbi:MAG TPA: hypothetical protein VMT64_11100 [Candidatus Binataceae bacterium]|nr:hypothetical protein [Candidatus Binataceae bacterium]